MLDDGMFLIQPNLYLSTYNQVQLATEDFFQVNCTKDLPMVRAGIRIAIDDDPYEADAMFDSLMHAVRCIDTQLKKGPGCIVVVHCLAALSRSPCVICAYLMWKLGMSMDVAIAHIQQVRPEAFTFSTNFHTTLARFELSLIKIEF